MSQVIVTRDKWKKNRTKSAVQEHAIQKEAYFGRWRRNDITKGYDPFAKVAGIVSLPIAVAWGFLIALGGLTLTLATWICRGLGMLIQPLLRRSR